MKKKMMMIVTVMLLMMMVVMMMIMVMMTIVMMLMVVVMVMLIRPDPPPLSFPSLFSPSNPNLSSLSLPWLLTRMERRGCHVIPLLAGCPRGLSTLSTSAAGLFSGKKKFRLISGHFEKFRLLYEKRKVETHFWTL